MELRHLRTIATVTRHRSLTKAGEELFLSQSAVRAWPARTSAWL